MSRQDEILGLHPINHHVIGEWLDYEDKEPTEVSSHFRTVLRTLIKMYTFGPNLKFGTK